MKAVGIIPARLGSTRLPEKVLRPLNGEPMIFHVWQRVRQAKRLDEILIACDDSRVEDCVKSFGAKAVMTRRDHPNGSSRVAEAAAICGGDIIVNIQGDEPLIAPQNIDLIVEAFERNPGDDAVTLAIRKKDPEEYLNPNVVKVVCGEDSRALYFSRAPLPYHREGMGDVCYLKHLGIYGYRRDFLSEFVRWENGMLEDIEKLEQLRILERGRSIRVVETIHDSYSVDTEEDIPAVEARLKSLS